MDADLLKEHLQCARQYLLGAMLEEYLFRLEWARSALDTLPEGDIRNRLNDTITELTNDVSLTTRSRRKPKESGFLR